METTEENVGYYKKQVDNFFTYRPEDEKDALEGWLLCAQELIDSENKAAEEALEDFVFRGIELFSYIAMVQRISALGDCRKAVENTTAWKEHRSDNVDLEPISI